MQDDTSAADILMGDVVRLEDVLSRDSVRSVSKSFFALFGLSRSRDLPRRAICSLTRIVIARSATTSTRWPPADASVRTPLAWFETWSRIAGLSSTPCFTGAVYRIAPLAYQGRSIGRVIVGPYVPAETHQAPASLTSIDDGIDVPTVHEHFDRMPRVREDIAEQLCAHLSGVLELLVFAGHRAQLASTMQVASVRETIESSQKKMRP